jgi:hypothetical protein
LTYGRPFVIQSALPGKRRLEIKGNNLVINKAELNKKEQQFEFDKQTKTIRSVVNKQSISMNGSNLQTQKTDARWYQLWKYNNNEFKNINQDRVFEVSGGKDADGTNVITYSRTGKTQQKWNIVFVDEDKKQEPDDGELDPESGFHVSRPFHIVTSLSSGRYVDLISNRAVIKTANGRDTQVWVYDWKTKCIR